MLALTATTGKIGGATLDAILRYELLDKKDFIVLTSSSDEHPRVKEMKERGISVKSDCNYGDTDSMANALKGCDSLFLVSTPEIQLDFNNAPNGKGRESRHYSAIDAAISAVVQHIYYTSLAFKDGSKAGVMRAHFRTEAYLKEKQRQNQLRSYTAIREGLYSESWPLYLGHYSLSGKETRKEIVVAGDGQISWTSISDLGLANAMIITSPNDARFNNSVIHLSNTATLTLKDLASKVDKTLSIRSESEYIEHYEKEHEMQAPFLEWWASTYPSVQEGHCDIQDPLLTELLAKHGRQPESFDSILNTMVQK
ncbi:NAD(P)-binding protein [Meira miltonrushii]|uniref:NAD(P)-binding protein n=1 Tax=Meira miltonrushii TaxID=1280837 RepID=A0A316V6L9_9BASI|nr:NAD(P)-binding protein [Meira miltonrushii]PWN32678.1 NAD(P)-binding protein [Meira miltonrushii]